MKILRLQIGVISRLAENIGELRRHITFAIIAVETYAADIIGKSQLRSQLAIVRHSRRAADDRSAWQVVDKIVLKSIIPQSRDKPKALEGRKLIVGIATEI